MSFSVTSTEHPRELMSIVFASLYFLASHLVCASRLFHMKILCQTSVAVTEGVDYVVRGFRLRDWFCCLLCKWLQMLTPTLSIQVIGA